jgi:hypothetical protein
MVVYRTGTPLEALSLINELQKRGFQVVEKGQEIIEVDNPFGLTFASASFFLTDGKREILISAGAAREEIEEIFGPLPEQRVVPLEK